MTRSAPLAAAWRRASRSLSALPARSPTTGLSWASAILSELVIACVMKRHYGLRRPKRKRKRATQHRRYGGGVSPTPATALGLGAILLWSTLASLTALKGPVPPFQTTAI